MIRVIWKWRVFKKGLKNEKGNKIILSKKRMTKPRPIGISNALNYDKRDNTSINIVSVQDCK